MIFSQKVCTFKLENFVSEFQILLGGPIPRRKLPPEDAVGYYTDPKSRGYLADPEKVAEERYLLSQKYGYVLPNIDNDPSVSHWSFWKITTI